MHFSNSLQNSSELIQIEQRQNDILTIISNDVLELEKFDVQVSFNVIPNIIRNITSCFDLKFTLDKSMKTRIISILLATYLYKPFNISSPVLFKSSILGIISKLIKRYEGPHVWYSYKQCQCIGGGENTELATVIKPYYECLWQEMLELTLQLRCDMSELNEEGLGASVSECDITNNKHLNNLSKALSVTIHKLRHHYQDPNLITTTNGVDVRLDSAVTPAMIDAKQVECDGIVNRAMKCFLLDATAGAEVTNLNTVQCFEGVLLLVLCLPTDYHNYSQHISLWISIWSVIQHNIYWDCCWLTILTRSRKYIFQHDFSSNSGLGNNREGQSMADIVKTRLTPVLYVKLRELLKIPSISMSDMKASGGGAQPGLIKNDYPSVLPSYYTRLVPLETDAHKVSINKICKLLYFTIYSDMVLVGGSSTVAASPTMSTSPDILYLLQDLNAPSVFKQIHQYPGLTCSSDITPAMNDFIVFLNTIRAYFYPSNAGEYTVQLGYFVATLVGEMSRHVARCYSFSLYRGVGSSVVEGPDGNGSGKSTDPDFDSVKSRVQLFEYLYGTKATRNVAFMNIKTLCGVVLPLLLEGLYGKSPFMIQLCGVSMRNLCGLEPQLGCVFLHTVIKSLDKNAVHSAHQAPVALQSIALCIRHLLAPQPYLVLYLQELLHNSLPGIDPNDPYKTSMALICYAAIFDWIPIKSKYSLSDFEFKSELSYIDVLSEECGHCLKNSDILPYVQKLGSYMISGDPSHSFVDLFIDRLLQLLDGRERKQKKSKNDKVTGTFDEAASRFLTAIADEGVRERCVLKICDYAVKYVSNSKTVSVNALKEYCSLFEGIGASCGYAAHVARKSSDNRNHNKALVGVILNKLLGIPLNSVAETGVQVDLKKLVAMTPEKISFLLCIAGASCRVAGSSVVCEYYSSLLQIITCKDLANHADKCVRKSVGKLLRDVLRGLTGVYILPKPLNANMDLSDLSCTLRLNRTADIPWNIPSETPGAYPAAIHIMAATADTYIQEIRSSIKSLAQRGDGDADADGAANKKKVDLIIDYLYHLKRCIRGCSEAMEFDIEVLANGCDNSCGSEGNVSEDPNMKGVYPSVNVLTQDYPVLLNYYQKVLDFLLEIFTLQVKPSHALEATESGGEVAEASGLTLLCNNREFYEMCCKIMHRITLYRMNRCKTVGEVKKFYNITKRMTSTAVTRYMSKVMKTMDLDAKSPNPHKTRAYWRCQHLSQDMIYTRLLVQRYQYLRWVAKNGMKFLSMPSVYVAGGRSSIPNALWPRCPFSSMKCVPNPASKVFNALLLGYIIDTMCMHEYSDIRQTGYSYFKSISARLDQTRIHHIASKLLNSLSATNLEKLEMKKLIHSGKDSSAPRDACYSLMDGTVRLLTVDPIMKCINYHPDLAIKFQMLVLNSTTLATRFVTEQDKQLGLVEAFSVLFVKYATNWCRWSLDWCEFINSGKFNQDPAVGAGLESVGAGKGENSEVDGLIQLCLSICGGSESMQENTVSGGRVLAAPSHGLRLHVFALFILYLYVIPTPGSDAGSASVPHVCSLRNTRGRIVTWLRKVLNSSDPATAEVLTNYPIPIKKMLTHMIRKLCWWDAGCLFETSIHNTKVSANGVEVDVETRQHGGLSNDDNSQLFHHIALLVLDEHTKVAENHVMDSSGTSAAQWSYGIIEICNECYLNETVAYPRTQPSYETDNRYCSNFVRKSNMVLYHTLFRAELVLLNGNVDAKLIAFASKKIEFCSQLAHKPHHSRSNDGGSIAHPSVELAEDEKKGLNITQAEMFGGLMRAVLEYLEDPNMTWKNDTVIEVTHALQLYLSELLQNVKLSHEYAKDWAEAVYFAYSRLVNQRMMDQFHENKLTQYFPRVMAQLLDESRSMGDTASSKDASELIVDVANSNASTGFNRESKLLSIVRAYLSAVTRARNNTLNQEHKLDVGIEFDMLFQPFLELVVAEARNLNEMELHNGKKVNLNHIQSILYSPYVVTRQELSTVIYTFFDCQSACLVLDRMINTKSSPHSDTAITKPAFSDYLSEVYKRLHHLSVQYNKELDGSVCTSMEYVTHYIRTGEFQELGVTSSESTMESRSQQEIVELENTSIKTQMATVYEMCILVFGNAIHTLNTILYIEHVPLLLNIALSGVGVLSIDTVLSKQCANVAIIACNSIKLPLPLASTNKENVQYQLTCLFRICELHMLTTKSVVVKKVAITCIIALYINHVSILSSDQKKDYKNVLLSCIGISNKINRNSASSITNSDVIDLVQYGLLMYLATKSASELKKLANGYIKNCTLLYEKVRSIQKRKKAENSGIATDVAVDFTLASTIVVSCCMVMLYPVDVPQYVPALLSALLKFLTIGGGSGQVSGEAGSSLNFVVLKDLIKKMVLEFKRSHQDRYKDIEFKHLFSSEEWDDLQGSGTAASYFS